MRIHARITALALLGRVVFHGNPAFASPVRTLCFSRFLPQHCTVQQAFDATRAQFLEHNIPEPEESARHLVCAAGDLGHRYSDLAGSASQVLPALAVERLYGFVSRRLEREPVQYIVGNWDFCGVTLDLRAPVLIPRPETEELVDKVARLCAQRECCVLDVGCGSGAIGLALLDMLPNAHCVGVDVSEEAVALSLHNAVKLGLQARYTCLKTSIKDMSTEHPDMLGRFYLVVSNPPYIPSQEMLNLENELRFEDVRALYGGEDGLDIIKQIIFAAPELLSADGAREVWMEVSHTHPEELEKRFRYGSLGSRINALEWFRDLSGRPRIVKLRMS